MTLIDPLEGMDLDGTHVLETGTDHPDHAIKKGDRLIVRETGMAPIGALVVVDMGGVYSLTTHSDDSTLKVHGVVVAVIRKVEL